MILVVHHTAEDGDNQHSKINSSHKNRGYEESVYGIHIAYHFLVETSGEVIPNRATYERTGTTRNSEVNNHAIAIVFSGNFQVEQPTPEQLQAARDLIKNLDSIYNFDEIIPHRWASPTACPGDNIMTALDDMWRTTHTWEIWDVTRYYTPVRGQERYFRSVKDSVFIATAKKWDYITNSGSQIMFNDEIIGDSLEEADQWFHDRPAIRDSLRRDLEYEEDFVVNCWGNCLSTASSYILKPEDAFKVAACPPEIPFGTKVEVEGIGVLSCRDHGSAIQNRRIDIWAGQSTQALDNLRKYPGGYLRLRFLSEEVIERSISAPSSNWFLK